MNQCKENESVRLCWEELFVSEFREVQGYCHHTSLRTCPHDQEGASPTNCGGSTLSSRANSAARLPCWDCARACWRHLPLTCSRDCHGLPKNFSHKDILNPLGMGAILLAASYVRFLIINIVTLEIGACFSKACFCSQSFPVRTEASGSYLHRLHTWAQVWMGSGWGTNRSHTLTPEKRPCPLSSSNMTKEWNCAGHFY